MKLLLIEDDENKRERLLEFLRDTLGVVDVRTAASYHSAIGEITNELPQVILLDMTIPWFDIGPDENGGASELFGGEEVLEHMDRKGVVVPTIVVTQFDRFGEGSGTKTLDELDRFMKRTYPLCYRGAVYYNAAQEDWKARLTEELKSIIQEDAGNP
ncbi:MAG: hypothetical protein U0R19_35705 [Bryobacteraceae bacterium]